MHLNENKITYFSSFGPRDRPLCSANKMKRGSKYLKRDKGMEAYTQYSDDSSEFSQASDIEDDIENSLTTVLPIYR
ncbi:hypothetical protein TSAR_002980, partial [Trichomalopsis sarcophagae]